MALVLADRVRETTAVVGTGTATLLGAIASYQSFAAIGNANTVYYTIVDQSTGAWEVGIGTYTASETTLSRDTVLSSSNAGALVNFAAGTKDVWGDYPAGKAVTTDTLAYPPAIGSTTPAAGTFTTLTATGQTSLGGAAGSEGLRVNAVAGSNTWLDVTGSSANRVDVTALGPTGSNVALRLSSRGSEPVRFFTIAQTVEQFRVSSTASAVNFVQVTGAVTTAVPAISFQGSDSNISGSLVSKGSGTLRFLTNTTVEQLRVLHTGSAVNYSTATGSATGQGVVFSVAGTDTNISQVFQSKGTGAIDLAPGSSGVNISNGGTVTAITVTASGNSYTSIPSCAITAPTTAGGVQATATPVMFSGSSSTVASGGTGYTVGDVLTVVGGTYTTQTTFSVASVSAGVVTAVTRVSGAGYSVLPSNPVTTTGGTGSGATLNAVWTVGPLTITNAGSGYVEQPTVTFSGGGGSGAAAYASVGSIPTVKTVGSALSFATPSGEQFRVRDNTTTAVNYGTIKGSGSGSTVDFGVDGTDGSITLALKSKATGGIALYTGGGNQLQLIVPHTASAVNYVQVTGAATGGAPTISAQGSDTNIGFTFNGKGTGSHTFQTNGTTRLVVNSGGTVQLGYSNSNPCLTVIGQTSQVNGLQVTGAAAGAAPAFSVAGTDTNISQVFQSKGTGAIDLAPGSSGVNISNGGTVTAITRTAGGTGYATAPTVAISAPTTAGGVQATATCTVTAGVVDTTFTITNAGSGYVEQPTVTFSGGGGSGAAAYTSVGAGSIIRSLGSTGTHSLDFYTPAGLITGIPNLRLRDTTGDSYWTSSNQTQTALLTASGNTNAIAMIIAAGTGNVTLRTGGGSQFEQLRVSHTAAAVNYVQVTGAATGGAPTISAQGSDADTSMVIRAKGAGTLFLETVGASDVRLQPRGIRTLSVNGAASGVNYFSMTGASAGNTPSLAVLGSDTNIDLALTPKGTGNVRFGAFTASVLTPTGYVEIKDSGGTIRRLLVG